ncbi:cytochrome P450 302a1, mitochondrial, partial [Trichonephila inaurata madagascariensis]
MPFSHGVRRCVGQRFAEQEMRLCIIKIIQNFRVEYDGPEVGTIMRLSFIPDKPLNFKFIPRRKDEYQRLQGSTTENEQNESIPIIKDLKK